MATRWEDNDVLKELSQMKIPDISEDEKETSQNPIDYVLNKILRHYNSNQLEEKIEDGLAYINWNIKQVFKENKFVLISDLKFEYNMLKFSYEKTSPGTDATHHEGFLIIYSKDGESIQYITDRNSDAKRIIRRLLKYGGKEEIIENNYEINSDFIIWMINKVYYKNNNIEIDGDKKNIVLDDIKGFRGSSEDLLTRVSADGESVMNIISTMSFLLESSNINSVKIDLSYKEHDSIEIQINTNNYISITPDLYAGPLNQLNTKDKICQLYLLLFTEIMPHILQSYLSEKDISERDEDGDSIVQKWSDDIYIDFLNDVAKDLQTQIKLKADKLKVKENSDIKENNEVQDDNQCDKV